MTTQAPRSWRAGALRRVGSATAAIAIGALVLSGCSSSSSPEGGGDAAKDIVNLVTPAQPESLDPQISTDSIMGEITGPIFETLVTADADLQVQPMLAEKYEVSDDALEYTFTLREGVKFQDGSDLDADDVVASMNRWTRVSVAAQEAFAGSEWTKVDDTTVKLTVTSPSFLHLLYLSQVSTAYPAILPTEVLDKVGDGPIEDVADIIGTGPYKLTEWDADQKVVIEKWDEYQSRTEPSSGRAGAKDATITEVVFNFVPDASTRTLGLQSGQYDATTELPFDSLDQFKDDENIVLDTYMVGPINLVYSDDASSPFSNVVNRQAINTGLDRDPIMLSAVGSKDLYDLVHHNMTLGQKSIWDTEVGKADFNTVDVAKAKEMLAEGGYTGEPVTVLANKDYSEAYNAAVVVVEQLKGMGVDATLDAYEWGAFSEKYRERRSEWDLVVFPFGTELDPTQTIGFLPTRAGYFDGPELQALLTKFRSAPTQAEASALFDDMQSWIEETRPMSRIGDAHNVYAANKDLDPAWFDGHFMWWNAKWKN
ncbi:ABC transporter substrate-binding protein [Leucobacter aridicollis]|uniref:ABC transporter substrate-binding protein n=1 Tax=Leucobacter aridicollis TaxID=283878 RepID=UPI0021672FEC|nr:ABC transporter substrate-binding protein [Leucobacter aridicollis]MCS3429470.1 peptide/nickel transport system substrate-binding protein [Leucobacter aridicollis]